MNTIVNKIINEAEESEDLNSYMDILNTKEDLDPELAMYLTHDTRIGDMIRHPLVQSIMHSPMLNAMVNKQFKWKKKATTEALEQKDFARYIFLYERPYRLDAFVTIKDGLPDKDYWELLGEIWTDSENIWQNKATWKKLLSSKRAGRNNIMSPEELKVFKKLPDIVTVYRGHQGKNKTGFSFTLDKDKADWFANRWKSAGTTGKTDTVQVPKSKIIAYFSGRGESEVVII